VGDIYSVVSVRKNYLNFWTELLKVVLSDGPSGVYLSHPSHEDGSRPSFRNVAFLIVL
jgi:hypothetical protein